MRIIVRSTNKIRLHDRPGYVKSSSEDWNPCLELGVMAEVACSRNPSPPKP